MVDHNHVPQSLRDNAYNTSFAIGERLSGCILSHEFHQADRTHICPILLDVFQTRGARIRSVRNAPAGRDVDEARPKGMLSLVIDQNMEDAIFSFEWVGHVTISRSRIALKLVCLTPLCSITSYHT